MDNHALATVTAATQGTTTIAIEFVKLDDLRRYVVKYNDQDRNDKDCTGVHLDLSHRHELIVVCSMHPRTQTTETFNQGLSTKNNSFPR